MTEQAEIQSRAKIKSGITRHPQDPESVEVRAALRSMDPDRREAYVSYAIEHNDFATINALQSVSPVTYGA